MLKLTLTKSEYEALDAGLQVLYVEAEDGYKLDVEGNQSDEEEAARRQAEQQAEDAARQAAKITRLEEQLAEARKASQKPATDTARIAALEEQLEAERKARTDERFNGIVRDAVVKAGVVPEAADDAVRRIKADGMGLQDDGTVASVVDGQPTVPLADYLKGLRKTASFMFTKPRGTVDSAGREVKQPTRKLTDANPESFLKNLDAIADGEMTVEWGETVN